MEKDLGDIQQLKMLNGWNTAARIPSHVSDGMYDMYFIKWICFIEKKKLRGRIRHFSFSTILELSYF